MNKYKRRKLRIGRVAIVMVFFLVLIILLGTIFAAKADATDEYARSLKKVVVRENDTLWSIVKENYNYKDDIRGAIYEVKKINNINTSHIEPGQVLYIPVE
jgi:nucleoid-associated protein YgaU